jgi:hypothetical protein
MFFDLVSQDIEMVNCEALEVLINFLELFFHKTSVFLLC